MLHHGTILLFNCSDIVVYDIFIIQSYSRSPLLMEQFYHRALNTLSMDAADILLLEWHNLPGVAAHPGVCPDMRDKGMFRFDNGHATDLDYLDYH